METLHVVKSTQSSNTGYITTLEAETIKKTSLGEVIMPFGKRYLVKTVNQFAEGEEVNIDWTEFDTREETFMGDDGSEKTVTWLNPK